VGPHSWRANHPLTVQAQIFHGTEEAGYGYRGFSPANNPAGGYGVWGVDGAGMDPNGVPSNVDATLVDHGFPSCPNRPAKPDPPPSALARPGMITAALGNALGDDVLRRAFADRELERVLRPVIGVERFSTSP
jgi:hypothetical protein